MSPTVLAPVERRETKSRQRTRPALIRVLHVINGEHYAGAERVQDRLAAKLPDYGYEVGFACLKPGRFEEMREYREAEIHNVTMRSKFDLRSAYRLANLVREQGYRIIHTHGPRTAMIGAIAARIARVPLVHHIHTQTHREVGAAIGRRFSAWVERQSLRGAAGLIAVSPSIAGYLANHGYSSRRIWTVANGVPARPLPPQKPQPDEWTVGLLALFRPRKGIETVLAAVSQLRADGVPVRLRVVGSFESPEYEQQMRRLAGELSIETAVDWVGFRTDIDGELQQMDVFVLPSLLSEGLPMSVLEAMAVGTPVVASRVDGVTDVVRDGVDGLLCAPGDAVELAGVLRRIVRNQADVASMRQIAHDRQTRQFSDRSMADGVAGAYAEVLN